MCLGIPMKVMEIDEFMARCEAKGIERDVSLFMLQHEDVDVGDYVVVHVGYAIQKVTPAEARTAWEIYDDMLAKEEAEHDMRTQQSQANA
ncbi:MAG: HypC/HybG/HupF family hydrogenase formation chaperone [Gammaproteobacteria bacterium]|nr:HypC/HybG/HupF family hydrogenase formation chaperone [Gammaproteobacteria bacterium]